MKKILLLIPVLFILHSCGKNFKVEKDKYPDIPEFPKFKNDQLKMTKIDEVVFDFDDDEFGQHFNTRYIVKDSVLGIVIFTSNTGMMEHPTKKDPFVVNLTVIKGDKIMSKQRNDDDFAFNFKIDSLNNDITIGKTKYFAKSDYLKFDSIPNLKEENFVDKVASFEYDDTVFYKPYLFDKAIVDKDYKVDGAQNSPLFVIKTVPLFMYYYQVRTRGKVGLTKLKNKFINNIINANNELYYLEKPVKVKDKQYKVEIYRIE
ncbi:hypothetical protein [Soonwooa sp.]|uniref:hypothetical protein n=1 Tax=Soonwooa sp. TaxID=1938592 RepID=UPI002635092F|nr:hypothetical protein [Soonwooa sp.]